MAKRILTLDIGASSLTLAEFSVGKGGATLLKYGMGALPGPFDPMGAVDVLPAALLGIARENGISPGKVAVSLPGQMAFPRTAEIQAKPGTERFDQLVRYEIEQNIPFPMDELVCDTHVIGETPAGDNSILIAAAKTDQVEAVTSAVSAAGFTPVRVGTAPFALVEVLAETGVEGTPLVLDIGAKTTSLVIVENERIYNRSIAVAGNAVTKEIAQALGCSLEEAEQLKISQGYVSEGGVSENEDEVADRVSKACRAVMMRLGAEVSRSINFYRSQQGGAEPDRLYITGGTSLLPGVAEFFASSLGIEVETLNPFFAVSVSSQIDADTASADAVFLAPAAGMALQTARSPAIDIDLIPPSLVASRMQAARVWFVASGCAAAALAGVVFVAFLLHGREILARQKEVVEERVSSLREAERNAKKAMERFGAATNRAENLRALMARRGMAVQKINAVKQAIGDDLWIERWDGDRVTIRGWRDRVAAFTEYVASKTESGKVQPASEIVAERLKANPAVDAASVKVVEAKYIGKGDCMEQFVVEIKSK